MLVNLRATEAEGQRIAAERDQLRAQGESLGATLHETKRGFVREQEARAREFDERDRARQATIAELEKNLKALFGADERCRELERHAKVLQARLGDVEAGHEEEKARLVERHAKELLRLRGEIERQKALAEQQEVLLVERHRAEAQGAEAEQRELNDQLIQKYETLLLRREQEAEARRLADVRALTEEHARQMETARAGWQREREEALREAGADALERAEEGQRANNALLAQLRAKEAESEQRRQEAVQVGWRGPRRQGGGTGGIGAGREGDERQSLREIQSPDLRGGTRRLSLLRSLPGWG